MKRGEAVDVPDNGFEQARDCIESVPADADAKITRQPIHSNWPKHAKPSGATHNRWLARAVESRLVLCVGAGVRGDPFRYWGCRSEFIQFDSHRA